MTRELTNGETKHQLETIAAEEERVGGAVRIQLQLPIRVKSQQLEATAEREKVNSVMVVKALYLLENQN